MNVQFQKCDNPIRECEFSFPALWRMHEYWWIITLQNSLFHINIWIEIPNSITSVCIWCEYFWSPFFSIPDSRSIWTDGHRRKWKIDFGFENVERRPRNNSKKQYWLMDSYWLWATGCKYTFSLSVFPIHMHVCPLIRHNPLDRSSCVLLRGP